MYRFNSWAKPLKVYTGCLVWTSNRKDGQQWLRSIQTMFMWFSGARSKGFFFFFLMLNAEDWFFKHAPWDGPVLVKCFFWFWFYGEQLIFLLPGPQSLWSNFSAIQETKSLFFFLEIVFGWNNFLAWYPFANCVAFNEVHRGSMIVSLQIASLCKISFHYRETKIFKCQFVLAHGDLVVIRF